MTFDPRDTLDEEIDRALDVAPSADLLRRVRSRIAEEPVRRTRWTSVGVCAGGAVLAALLIGLRLLGDGSTVEAPATPASPARLASTHVVAPAAPAPVLARTGIERHVTRTANRVRASAARDAEEVLVPAAERQSLQRLLRAASRAPLVLARAYTTPTSELEGPPAPIIVPPIEIEPLVHESVDQGDSK